MLHLVSRQRSILTLLLQGQNLAKGKKLFYSIDFRNFIRTVIKAKLLKFISIYGRNKSKFKFPRFGFIVGGETNSIINSMQTAGQGLNIATLSNVVTVVVDMVTGSIVFCQA